MYIWRIHGVFFYKITFIYLILFIRCKVIALRHLSNGHPVCITRGWMHARARNRSADRRSINFNSRTKSANARGVVTLEFFGPLAARKYLIRFTRTMGCGVQRIQAISNSSSAAVPEEDLFLDARRAKPRFSRISNRLLSSTSLCSPCSIPPY